MRAALQNAKEAHGEAHEQTLLAMGWLALLLDRQGKLEEAEQLGRRSCALAARIEETEHVYAQSRRVNLANVLRRQGAMEESEQLLRNALELLRREVGI